MDEADCDWYVLDRGGRSYGPYERALLERLAVQGELAVDTPVWHTGLAQWQRAESLLSIPALDRPARVAPLPPPAPAAPARPRTVPAVARPAPASSRRPVPWAGPVARPELAPGTGVHVWQRVLAAAFDLLLLAIVLRVVAATVLSGHAPAWLTSRGGLLVAWAVLDGLMLAKLGTTPGKALLAVTLRAKGGSRLDDRRAFLRSAVLPLALFLVLGVGPALGILIVPLLGISWFRLRLGRDLWWDQMVAGEASYGELSQTRRFLIGAAFAVLLVAMVWLSRLLPEFTQRWI